jgi:hypothetical protein
MFYSMKRFSNISEEREFLREKWEKEDEVKCNKSKEYRKIKKNDE